MHTLSGGPRTANATPTLLGTYLIQASKLIRPRAVEMKREEKPDTELQNPDLGRNPHFRITIHHLRFLRVALIGRL